MPQIQWLAIVVAALSSFGLGGLWYSPSLFGTKWSEEAGDTRKPEEFHPAKVFGLSFFFALIAALVYALLVPPADNWVQAAVQGLLVGGGLVATSFGINYQFGNRSTTLLLIDGGYHTVQFCLFGLILGMWR